MLSFYPLDVLNEIWDLIEPDSDGFPTYSFIYYQRVTSTFKFNSKLKFLCLTVVTNDVTYILGTAWSLFDVILVRCFCCGYTYLKRN